MRATTVDALVGESNVTLMKIDVEGAEGLVLRGAEATLQRATPALVFEFSPPSLQNTSGVSGDELLDYLRGFGYAIDVVQPHGAARVAHTNADLLGAFEAADGDHIDLFAWKP